MPHDSKTVVTAASCASDAVAELLRYAREGDGLPGHPFGTQDPTVQLVQALIATARIERDGLAAKDGDAWQGEIWLLNELIGACESFVTDWSSNSTDAVSEGVGHA